MIAEGYLCRWQEQTQNASPVTELAYWRPIAAHDYSLAVIDAAYNLTKVFPVTING